VTERVHTFGTHGGLVGIVTEPAVRRPGAPAVLFSNVGLNHRVGPNRLFVELARGLAASGFLSLRFDLSGFGDSEPRRSTGGDLERATLDTREAMDFLERKDVKNFVLLGFCSGVDSAHAVALEDPRVVGVIFIDGYAYQNLGFWLRYCTIRNLQSARWRRYARERLARFLKDRRRGETGDTLEVYVRESPTQQKFASDLASLFERSVKMLFVYTVVADNHYNYRNQFHDTFGYRNQIDVEYFSRADHVFSTEDHRAKLLSRLLRWTDDSFPQRESNREAWIDARILEG
jgi:pimeloyl-ACP methyl ester carboxylesterase